MMFRRQILAAVPTISAIVAIRGAGAEPTATIAASMPGMDSGVMTSRDCVESCWRSHVMCLETERYCLGKGGAHVVPTHVALLADCAEMCEKTANSLLRGSPQHAVVCNACAELCDACALECESFKDDQRMSLCARTCRDCAKHCREMSKLPI